MNKNKFFEFLVWLLQKCFPSKQIKGVDKPKPTPPVNVAKGLLSMNLHCKDIVNQIFSNPLLKGAIKGTVDIGAYFKTSLPVLLHVNSNQKISWAFVDGGIRIDFDDTHPVVEIPSVFDIEMPMDFIFIDNTHARLSLVGAPDYKIYFV